jgi:hypothetical protein
LGGDDDSAKRGSSPAVRLGGVAGGANAATPAYEAILHDWYTPIPILFLAWAAGELLGVRA